MKPGDVVRAQRVKSYGADGVSFIEYAVNEPRQPKKSRRVALLFYLGTEPLLEQESEEYLRALFKVHGWVPIDEAVKAGADAEKLGFETQEKG